MNEVIVDNPMNEVIIDVNTDEVIMDNPMNEVIIDVNTDEVIIDVNTEEVIIDVNTINPNFCNTSLFYAIRNSYNYCHPLLSQI
jgi:hypothetical protein